VVHTVEEFLDALQFQPHLERVVVLPNGIELLKQQGALPEQLILAACGGKSVRSLLECMGPKAMGSFRARLWHYGRRGAEKEIKASTAEGQVEQLPKTTCNFPA
ncbi:unnamed protein product, partial [Polarella glacialis]